MSSLESPSPRSIARPAPHRASWRSSSLPHAQKCPSSALALPSPNTAKRVPANMFVSAPSAALVFRTHVMVPVST
eukprot:1041557-Prorocentrum_minimum.AAC.5